MFNNTLKLAKSKDTFQDVANWIESGEKDSKPDLVWSRYQPRSRRPHGDAHIKTTSKVDDERKENIARIAWPRVVVAVEVNGNTA